MRKANKWTEEEVKALQKLYPLYKRNLVSKEELERVFNRTFLAISTKATRLGIAGIEYSIMNKKLFQQLLKRGEEIEI